MQSPLRKVTPPGTPLQVPGLSVESPGESYLQGGLSGRELTLVRPTMQGRKRKSTLLRLEASPPHATSCHGHNYYECWFQRHAQGFATKTLAFRFCCVVTCAPMVAWPCLPRRNERSQQNKEKAPASFLRASQALPSPLLARMRQTIKHPRDVPFKKFHHFHQP